MRTARTACVLLGLPALVLWGSGCGGKETYNAKISYVLEPTQGVPEGVKTVAVLDAGADVAGTGEDADRSKKWATIAADMMEQMIRDSASKHGSGLAVAKRRDTKKVMDEQDLKAAGLVDKDTASKAAKLLDVQALITSKLNIRVEVKQSKKTTFDVTSVAAAAGYHWGAGSAGIGAREADEISRNMTLQCKFSMVDPATGEAYFEYAPKPFAKHDKKTPGVVFGRSAGEGDLDPVDMYIGELVEKGVREFVSMFVPCEVEYAYDLESSGSKESAAGVAALRAEDYEAALHHFQAAVAKDPQDHGSLFCMGVTCELMKDWDGALKYYQRVCGMMDVPRHEMEGKYMVAKNRLAAQKDRIHRDTKKK